MSSYGPGSGYPPPPGYLGQVPGGMMTPPPPNYLVWAILVTIFCCLPLGIPAIVFAAQVSSRWQAGDVAGAHDASTKAKTFCIWAAVGGGVLIVGYVAANLALVASLVAVY